MDKTSLGPQTLIYPMPAFLIGANIDGKSNFMTAAWSGIANSNPPMITVAIQHPRYTLKGIRQNWTFSVNVPSRALVKETDFCGTVSGTQVDKVEICRFHVFYGKLGTAPLIEQCPVNLECQVMNMLNLGSHMLVLGKIEEVFASNSCLTGGSPDVNKIKPISYSPRPGSQYFTLGEAVGKAFNIGKDLATKS